jgi:hypothetical protein
VQERHPDRPFWIFWILIQLGLGWLDFINMPVFGMHQGAQADRACVAWNFWHESMNFFEPRVMENRAAEGVAGMEFPILPYITALLYQIFGFKPIIYRLLIGGIVTYGMWAAWRILSLHITRTLSKLALLGIYYLSPTFVFYTWNFLSDPAALSLAIIALYHWIQWQYNIEPKKNWIIYLLLITFTGLIKVSFLIVHIAVCLVLFTQSRKKNQSVVQTADNTYQILDEAEDRINFPKFNPLTLILPILPIIGWVYYAKYLTDLTYNTHFLQQINPSRSVSEFISVTQYSLNTWVDSLYIPWCITGILFVWGFTMIKNRTSLSVFEQLSVWLFLGFAGLYFLFHLQFRYHDYYFLSAWPFIFFAIFSLQQRYLNGQIFFQGLPAIASMLGLWIIPFVSFGHANRMLHHRFTPNDYYAQNVVTDIKDLEILGSWLKTNNTQDQEVFVAFDPSPNTALYALQTKGVRLGPDYQSNLAREIYQSKISQQSSDAKFFPNLSNEKKPNSNQIKGLRTLGFVVTNDTTRWFKEYANIAVPTPSHKPLTQSGKWFIFSIK